MAVRHVWHRHDRRLDPANTDLYTSRLPSGSFDVAQNEAVFVFIALSLSLSVTLSLSTPSPQITEKLSLSLSLSVRARARVCLDRGITFHVLQLSRDKE